LEYLEQAGVRAASLNANDQAAELWTRARKVAGRLNDAAAGQRLAERISSLRPGTETRP
jgi:ABC-type hemin transport system substrate-binding protein